MSFNDNGLRSEFYPQDPSPGEADAIHQRLADQWACIAAGEPWGDVLPEAIRAVRYGPLAWCKVPPTAMRILNGEASWLTPWVRPDGEYQTLSHLGREKLGVRPVGLTLRRRWQAVEAEIPDALWDATDGDTALIDGRWLPVVYPIDLRQPAGRPMHAGFPLYRWRDDWDTPTHIRQPWAPLEHPDRIAAEDRSRVFTRPRAANPIEAAMRAMTRT